MKFLIVVLSVAALASGQHQLLDPYFNEGLAQYNEWQPQAVPNVFNAYGVRLLQQFLPGQQLPLPVGQALPPVPVPFPAQYPFAVPQPGQLPIQVPVPQQLLPGFPVPPFNGFQQPFQFQMVRHGLPHSDAAAVSYSSLHYNGHPQALATPVPTVGVPQLPSGGVQAAAARVPVAPATPSHAAGNVSVVKDIATFRTEYGSGANKAPVARYEAISGGVVHVAPLPGHTVDQKLVAPGTVEQKL